MKNYLNLALGVGLMGLVGAQSVVVPNADRIDNAQRIYSGNLNVGDARYIGMGGAVGALGAGITASEQNPASIGVNINSEIAITPTLSNREFNSAFGVGNSSDLSAFNVGQIGGNLAIDTGNNDWNRVVIGLNVLTENIDRELIQGANPNVVYDRTIGFDDADNEIIEEYSFNGYATVHDGFRQKLNISVATSYQDKVYLGASLNFHSTDFDAFTTLAEEDSSGSIFVSNLNGSPYQELASGFSFAVGAMGRLDDFRLGLAYHSPVWWNDVEEEFFAASGLNDGFLEASDYSLFGSFYDLSSSSRFVASAGVIIGKVAALNFDYTYHINDPKYRPTSGFREVNQFMDNFLQNSSEYRVGGEARLDNFRIRAGYNFIETPMDDFVTEFGNPGVVANPDDAFITDTVSEVFQGDINRYSLGLGYDFGGFYVDAAYQYQNQEFTQIFGGGTFIDNDLFISEFDPFVDRIEANQNMFLLTLGWKF